MFAGAGEPNRTSTPAAPHWCDMPTKNLMRAASPIAALKVSAVSPEKVSKFTSTFLSWISATIRPRLCSSIAATSSQPHHLSVQRAHSSNITYLAKRPPHVFVAATSLCGSSCRHLARVRNRTAQNVTSLVCVRYHHIATDVLAAITGFCASLRL